MSTQVVNNYLLLMDASDLGQFQDISQNIDPKRINSSIRDAQDLDLALFMGDAFWYDFLNQFSNTGFLNAGTITATTTAADGTYANQAIVGGSGSGGMATFVVLGGKVTSITQTEPGINYAVDDTFTCAVIPGASFTITGLCGVLKPGTTQLYKNFYLGAIYNDLQGNPVTYAGIIPALAYWSFARFIEVDQIRYTTTGPVGKRHDQADPATPKQIAALVEIQRSKANAYCNKIEKFLYTFKQNFLLFRMSQQNKTSRQPGARIRAIDRTKYNRGYYGYRDGFNDIGGIDW